MLTARNDRTLRALLTDLLQDAGTVGEYALAADANLPGKMAKARAGVSHGGAAGTPTAMRYWLGQILLWVVRMHVVREVGVDNDRIQRRVLQKPSFRHAVQQATARPAQGAPDRRPSCRFDGSSDLSMVTASRS